MEARRLTDFVIELIGGEETLGAGDRGRIETAVAGALERGRPGERPADSYLLGMFEGHPEFDHVAWRLEEALRASSAGGLAEILLTEGAAGTRPNEGATVINAVGCDDPRVAFAIGRGAREAAAGAGPKDPPVVVLAGDLAARERAALLWGRGAGHEGDTPGDHGGPSEGARGG